MTKPDMALLTWTKSSRSGDAGDCVEIARAREMVFVRDSKDASGPVLAFSATAWRAFVHDPPCTGSVG